jgi:integrase
MVTLSKAVGGGNGSGTFAHMLTAWLSSRRRKAAAPEGVRSRAGKRCSCQPYYEASVGLGLRGERRSKSFSTAREAREWRIRMLAASQRRRRAVASRDTLRDAAETYVSGMSSGMIKNRSGDAYKPKVVRDYESTLRLYVLPDLGGRRISDIRPPDLQRLVERIAAAGMSPSTIRNAINPVRAIYRRAVQLDDVPDDPTAAIVLPSVRSRRDRVAEPAEASRLVDAVPDTDRVVWALGLYAGLRRGEIMALRWCDVDFSKREIRVERGWDDKVGAIEPKSRSARRSVPMAERLAVMLRTQRERCAEAGDGDGLVSGSSPVEPFGPTGLHCRARPRVEERRVAPDRPSRGASHLRAQRCLARARAHGPRPDRLDTTTLAGRDTGAPLGTKTAPLPPAACRRTHHPDTPAAPASTSPAAGPAGTS